MAKKFSLTPDPTFKKKVDIPIPGGKAAQVEFTFKHRSKEQMSEWLEGMGNYKTDAATVLDIASGWDLDEPFDADNIETLCNEYAGAGRAIINAYAHEASGGLLRLGN